VNAWKVILATLVIFGAGVITGGLLVRFVDSSTPHPPQTQPGTPEKHSGTVGATARQNKLPAPLPGPLRKDFLDRLDHDLKLDPKQHECIEKIICEGQEKTKAIWDEVEPDMHDVLVETRSRICSELTPEQRACFEQSVKQKAKNGTNAPPAAPTPALKP
jgi:hypothetical protein